MFYGDITGVAEEGEGWEGAGCRGEYGGWKCDFGDYAAFGVEDAGVESGEGDEFVGWWGAVL